MDGRQVRPERLRCGGSASRAVRPTTVRRCRSHTVTAAQAQRVSIAAIIRPGPHHPALHVILPGRILEARTGTPGIAGQQPFRTPSRPFYVRDPDRVTSLVHSKNLDPVCNRSNTRHVYTATCIDEP